jgi:hypothetical protein
VAQDWTPAEFDALRRYVKGKRLGQSARRTLGKLEERLASERRYNRRPEVQRQEEEMYANIDQALREGWMRKQGPDSFPATATRGKGSPGSPAPHGAVAGGAAAAAPRSTGIAPGGGAALRRSSSFDARTAPFEDVQVRLAQLGVSAPYMENRPNAQPRPNAPGLGILVKRQKIASEAEKRRAARSAELDATKIDGRSADPEVVRQRLAALHIDHDIAAGIREIGKPLPKLEEFNPVAASIEARRRAERRAREATKSGKPVDVKRMSDDVYQEYLRIRGLQPPSSWGPGTRTPPRR